MAKFEVVNKYKDAGIVLPERKTACSAGYDFQVAKDTLIQPYTYLMDRLRDAYPDYVTFSIDEMADATKKTNARPSLVPTGIKCKLNGDNYLELAIRSSSPLKYWLVLANSEGIIDADYYNNPDNEGHILIAFKTEKDMNLNLGEKFCQGIITKFIVTDDDEAGGTRIGGIGSTN